MSTQQFSIKVTSNNARALDLLADNSKLPKMRIKDAMAKGAVWHKRNNKTTRLRRATTTLKAGDEIHFHYNPEILARNPEQAKLLSDEKDYSVWIKPAGMLAQGTLEGDHCALLRVVEKTLQRESFLVHRLDREASGLMVIAHNKRAAAGFSALFARQTANDSAIRKIYQVQVRGALPENGRIDSTLDGKTALTHYRRLSLNIDNNTSLAEVELISGRKHQIRRHFAAIGFPVLGDPRYGESNRCAEGLQLYAVSLEFTCPLTKNHKHFLYNGHNEKPHLF